jgi:hypothetical protein
MAQRHSHRANVQMCRIAGNLVSEALGGDDGDLVADPLVGLEVER